MSRTAYALLLVVTVALAAAATAGATTVRVVQPGPAAGSATYLSFLSSGTSCASWGRYDRMQIGTSAAQIRRPLLRFDLSSIPAGSRIVSARLSLWQLITLRGSGTVQVHRVTSSWNEGTGINQCTGDGATWTDRLGNGSPWTTPGGDHDPTPVASRAKTAGQTPRWDTFDVTALVQSWVNATTANHGLLLRLANEAFSACTTLTNCNYWSYASDDHVDATLRPKLTIVTSP